MHTLIERIIKIVETATNMPPEIRRKFYDELGEMDEQELFSFWKTSLRTNDIAAIERRLSSFTEVKIGNVERALEYALKYR